MIAWLRDGAHTILKVDFVQHAAPDLRAVDNPTQPPEDTPTSVAQSVPFDIRNIPTISSKMMRPNSATPPLCSC